MPIPAAPKRAGPPRRKVPKSPPPAVPSGEDEGTEGAAVGVAGEETPVDYSQRDEKKEEGGEGDEEEGEDNSVTHSNLKHAMLCS